MPTSKASLVWCQLASVSPEGDLRGDFMTGVTHVMRSDRRKGGRHTAPRPGDGPTIAESWKPSERGGEPARLFTPVTRWLRNRLAKGWLVLVY